MHHVRGKTTRQAHVDLPEGTCEEEFARGGFSGRVSHLYRTASPVGWTSIDGELRPQAICATELPGLGGGDWLTGRVPFLSNDDVTLHLARFRQAMPYAFRNADADEILFVHRGAGRITTDFGPLAYETGDYLVVPRGAAYRLSPTEETTVLVIESTGEVSLPDRGMLGRHALFDTDVIEVPTPAPLPAGDARHTLKVQRCKRITTVEYPFDPLATTIGWKGDLSVWRLNVRDIRPVSSERYHLPPPAHATFVMPNAVVCTFLPRPLETGDPGALRVPFFHSNIDYDEVLFYHAGDFFSRAGIRPGMVTFHPQGIHHGPQPGAVASSMTRERTDEQAVMIDTRHPLEMTDAARKAALPDYWKSWMTKETR